jgi:hypothetical protein
MTTDDFEWVEATFDQWFFTHKDRLFACAKVYPYNGWHVVVEGQGPEDELVVESFDAAKVIATMLAAQQMEGFPNVTRYGKRSKNAPLQTIPRGVFKVG